MISRAELLCDNGDLLVVMHRLSMMDRFLLQQMIRIAELDRSSVPRAIAQGMLIPLLVEIIWSRFLRRKYQVKVFHGECAC